MKDISKVNLRILHVLFLSLFFVGILHAESEDASDAGADEDGPVPVNAGAYSSPATTSDKAILDENIRYLKTPPAQDKEFGILRERKVHLKLEGWETYDSNIYLTKDDTRPDWITHISPGVYAYYGNEKNIYFAFYDVEALLYAKNWKETRINQSLGARADMFRTSRVKLSVSDTLRPTTDPASSESDPFVKRVSNDLGTTIMYDMSEKTGVALTYHNFLQHYITAEYKGYSFMRHEVVPTAYWRVTPKTSVTGEFDLGITEYGGAGYNHIYYQLRVGLEGRLTPKSMIFAKAGYQYRSYEEADNKNTKGFVLEGVYNYFLSKKTTIELMAASNIDESTYGTEMYYKSINLYAAMTHIISYNLIANVSGFYINNNYPHETRVEEGMRKRNDNVYGASAKLTYSLANWMQAYAGYDFKVRNSNVRGFCYDDNILYSGIKMSF